MGKSRLSPAIRKKLKYTLYIFLFTCILLEVSLRMYYHEEEVNQNYWGLDAFQDDEELGYRHTPNFEGRMMRGDNFDVPVSINEQGLRQKDLTKQIGYNQKVLLLGDSFTFGLGVLEDESYASLLSAHYNKKGVGVINGGQTGYCITQEYLFGKRLIERYKPQRILLSVFPHNDVAGDYMKAYEKIDVAYGYRLSADRLFQNGFWDYIRTHSYAHKFVFSRIERITRERPDRKAPGFTENSILAIEKIKSLCDENGIELAVMIISDSDGKIDYKTVFTEFLDEEEIPYFIPSLSSENHFETDGHWNTTGHLKVFKQLVPFLDESKK